MKKGLILFFLLVMMGIPGYACYAATLKIWCSGGLMPVLQQIAPDWQKRSGILLDIEAAPSMGTTPQSIPQRLAHHQRADVLVMVEDGMAPLVTQGKVAAEDKVALANSWIALAVPAGDPVPDISTARNLREVLLKSRRVAYSDSASGRYVSSHLYRKLGIENVMRAKSQRIPATPVGTILAERKADIGFQQLSELRAVKGITVVGLLPSSLQKATRYSAVVLKQSQQQAQGRAFIRYLASGDVARVIREKGMDPLAADY